MYAMIADHIQGYMEPVQQYTAVMTFLSGTPNIT